MDDISSLNNQLKEQLLKGQQLVKSYRETNNTKDLDEAEFIFHRLLDVKPENTGCLFFMGCIHLLKENKGLAMIMFSLAYKKDKLFVNAANNLGIIYKENGWRDKARAIYLEAVETMKKEGHRLFPSKDEHDDLLADLYSNLGSCYTNNGTPEKALEYYRLSLELKDLKDKETPRFNMALALLEKGEYKEAWENYKYYSIIHTDRRIKNYHEDKNPTPKWKGDKSQVVAVLGEQGIGDELMFATMIPDLMQDMRIIFDAHPRLQNLFKNSWPELPIYGTRKDLQSNWQQFIKPDAYIPIAELCEYIRNDKEDFPGTPYLKTDKKLKPLLPDYFRQEKNKLRIGFSWTGGLISTNNLQRTIPQKEVVRLLKNDCDFISLQYKSEDNDNLRRLCAKEDIHNVHIFQDILDNYDLTACMLEELDFIMCAPQSVIFLAGALGLETYQLCPRRGMWQQGIYGQDMPWFKSVKNIWQKDFDKWDFVIDEAIRIINERINNR